MAAQITSDITEQLDYNDDVVQSHAEDGGNEEGELPEDREIQKSEKAAVKAASDLEDGELSDDNEQQEGETSNQHNWTPPGWRPGYCKFFMSNRGCRFGLQCRYIHPDPSEVQKAEAVAKPAAAPVVESKPEAAAAPVTAPDSENAAPKDDVAKEASEKGETAEKSTEKAETAAPAETKPAEPQTAANAANRPRLVLQAPGGPTTRDAEWLKAVSRARELHKRAKQRKMDADPESLREKNLNASLVEPAAKQAAAQSEASLHVEYADADDLYTDAIRSRTGGTFLETLDEVPSVDEATRELNELRRRKQAESSWKYYENERRERERERDRERVRERERERDRDRDRPREREREHERERERERPRARPREDTQKERERTRRDAEPRKRRHGNASNSESESEKDDRTKKSEPAPGKKRKAPSVSSSDSDSDSDLSSSLSDSSEEEARDRAKKHTDDGKKRKPDEQLRAKPAARRPDDKKRPAEIPKRAAPVDSPSKARERDRPTNAAEKRAVDSSGWNKDAAREKSRLSSESESDSDSDGARRRKRVSKFESEQSSNRGNSQKAFALADKKTASANSDGKTASGGKNEDDSRRAAASSLDKDTAKSLKRSELMKKLSDVQAALDRTQARIQKGRDSK